MKNIELEEDAGDFITISYMDEQEKKMVYPITDKIVCEIIRVLGRALQKGSFINKN